MRNEVNLHLKKVKNDPSTPQWNAHTHSHTHAYAGEAQRTHRHSELAVAIANYSQSVICSLTVLACLLTHVRTKFEKQCHIQTIAATMQAATLCLARAAALLYNTAELAFYGKASTETSNTLEQSRRTKQKLWRPLATTASMLTFVCSPARRLLCQSIDERWTKCVASQYAYPAISRERGRNKLGKLAG